RSPVLLACASSVSASPLLEPVPSVDVLPSVSSSIGAAGGGNTGMGSSGRPEMQALTKSATTGVGGKRGGTSGNASVVPAPAAPSSAPSSSPQAAERHPDRAMATADKERQSCIDACSYHFYTLGTSDPGPPPPCSTEHSATSSKPGAETLPKLPAPRCRQSRRRCRAQATRRRRRAPNRAPTPRQSSTRPRGRPCSWSTEHAQPLSFAPASESLPGASPSSDPSPSSSSSESSTHSPALQPCPFGHGSSQSPSSSLPPASSPPPESSTPESFPPESSPLGDSSHVVPLGASEPRQKSNSTSSSLCPATIT